MRNKDYAVLSNFDKYTTFSFGGTTLTFRTCNNLDRYTKVNQGHRSFASAKALRAADAQNCGQGCS